MSLSEQEREQVKAMIDRGEPLPPKYKLLLFADAPEVELIWQGKTSAVTNVVLPFQTIEQIDEPRQKAMEQVAHLFGADPRGRQSSGWTNKLIWGDNKLVLSSLKNGPLRKQIEEAGGLKLIYIDPPFDVGADFSVDVQVGDGGDILTKEPTVIEEQAFRDTWGDDGERYPSYMYERLRIMRDLLANDGAIVVHCDWHVSALIRLMLDEIFLPENFRNEIYWYYYNKMPDTRKGVFPRATDTLFWYVRDHDAQYTFKPLTERRDKAVKQLVRQKVDGRMINARDAAGNVMYQSREERVIDNVWRLSMLQPADKTQNLTYATQKPEHLLQRVLDATTNAGDLIADFFCGSGTTLAVAEKLGRKWIGCDLGRFAIHTARKRLIGVQRELKNEAKHYRSFEILNLGKYERQYFVGIDPNLPEEAKRVQTLQREEHYLNLILGAYKAERNFQMPPFHGRKGATAIVVGPIDAPVTLAQVNEVVAACKVNKINKVDVLGFEFEMGLVPTAQDEAKEKGVALSLRYIPKDVFDKRAVEKGQVKFYDVAYLEAAPKVDKLKVTVSLKNFGVFYRQDDADTVAGELKPGGSKVTVDGGQVVKISKAKAAPHKVTRETLTKKWTDWIDYWAVDFDFGDKKEIIRVVEGGEEKEQWTGNYIFENEWQNFRTRKERKLELSSAPHAYPAKGKYKIAVKVIDIFGNDTTKVIDVKV